MTKTRNRLISVGIALLVLIAAAVFIIPTTTASAAGEVWDGKAASSFAGGDGSETSPYQIANGAQLAYLAQQVNGGTNYSGMYFELANDIDLGGKEWTPIGNYPNTFKGKFSGKGYTISNLSINKPNDKDVGLFGYSIGEISNLAANGTVIGKSNVGGICGRNGDKCHIYACSFDGKVSGGMSNDCESVGGICGLSAGAVYNCFNSAVVSGYSKVGGICGSNYLQVSDDVTVGKVSGTDTGSLGSICGFIDDDGYNLLRCYYNTDICGDDIVPVGNQPDVADYNWCKKTTEDLCSDLLTRGSNLLSERLWVAGSNTVTPDPKYAGNKFADRFGIRTKTYVGLKNVGTRMIVSETPSYNFKTTGTDNVWEAYTPITSTADYLALTNDPAQWADNFVLVADLDFGGKEITPIGTTANRFKGKFSGNGHTISNFVISKTADTNNSNAGLFGFIHSGEVMDLAANGTVTGSDYVGGICGYALYGKIYRCSFDGEVTGTVGWAGGICGGTRGGNILSCFNSADVSAPENVGGICGYILSDAYVDRFSTIDNCVNVGKLSCDSADRLGGICGYNYDNSAKTVITNCIYDLDINSGIEAFNGHEFKDTTNTTGATTELLCGPVSAITGLDAAIWKDGNGTSINADADSKFGTSTLNYVSLNGIGSFEGVGTDVYNFKTNGADDWQEFTYIETPEDFIAFNNNSSKWTGNYVLKNDITISIDLGAARPDSGSFTGKFSGDGHTITLAADSSYGVFSSNKGTIMNLAIKGNINSNETIGGFCRENDGTIFGCSFEGKIQTTGTYASGICHDNRGTISNCFVIADIKASSDAGGICRFDASAHPVEYSYFVGILDASTTNMVSDANTCYFNKDFYKHPEYENGTGLSTIEMTSSNALGIMGFSDAIWEKKPNEDGIAYFPSLKGSSYQPSVKYTPELVLERSNDEELVCGKSYDFTAKALINFTYGFIDEPLSIEDEGLFNIEVNGVLYQGANLKYTAKAADDVTFKLSYSNGISKLIPDTTEEITLKFGKNDLTADDFEFSMFTSNLVYDGTPKAALVKPKSNLDGMGNQITVKYFDSKGNPVEKCINTGTYTVKIDVSAGTNYNAATDLTSDKWTFTIEKAAAVVIDKYTEVSYSWVTDSDETVTVVGLPANMGEVTVEEQRIDSANVVLATLDNDKCYADGKYTFHLGPNTAENVGQTGLIEVRLSTQNYERVTFLVIVTLNSKENQEAPDETAFDVVFTNDGDNLIATIDTKLKGVEYSFDGTTWSTANTKTVGHDVSVTAYIRYAETDDKNASPVVSKTANSGHGTLTHHAAVEATCQKDGNIEYWECKVCAKYYSDEAATKVIELADTVLAKTDHKWLDKYESDKDGHWHKCEYCDEVTEKQSHISSGEATTTSAEYCTECGYIISPKKNGGSTSGGHYSGGSGYRDTTPTETKPEINGTEKSWTDIAADLSKMIGGTVVITLNGETTLPADVIKAIADSKITAEIISDSTKSWIIDGAEITTVSAVDLSILPGSADTSALRGVTGVKLKLNAENVPADLKVAFKKQYAGEFANIYKLTDGKLVFQNCVKLASDGTAILPDMTAGEYAVMLCKYSDRPGDINNDGILSIADALSLLRYSVGLENGENPLMGDFNGDGKIDLADALAVLRKSVGLTA